MPAWGSGAEAPNAMLSPEESVAEMRRVIDGLTLGQSARFLSYDGSEVPW